MFLRQPFDIWVIDYIESGFRFDLLLGCRRDWIRLANRESPGLDSTCY